MGEDASCSFLEFGCLYLLDLLKTLIATFIPAEVPKEEIGLFFYAHLNCRLKKGDKYQLFITSEDTSTLVPIKHTKDTQIELTDN